jgi:hypothetical protein
MGRFVCASSLHHSTNYNLLHKSADLCAIIDHEVYLEMDKQLITIQEAKDSSECKKVHFLSNCALK